MTERLDNLILVDVFDNPIGTADKRRAHTVPLLHRAFSVFLINDRGELLLQKPLLIHPLPLRLYAVIAIILLRQQPFLQRIGQYLQFKAAQLHQKRR